MNSGLYLCICHQEVKGWSLLWLLSAYIFLFDQRLVFDVIINTQRHAHVAACKQCKLLFRYKSKVQHGGSFRVLSGVFTQS